MKLPERRMVIRMSDVKKSLASKLAAIGKEIGSVDKSGTNREQKYNFIPYSVVASRIRELLDKHHVIIIPSVNSIQQDEITSKYGNKGYHYVLEMSFTIVNGDDPEEREVAMWRGESSDFGDKGINKAETSGTKYFLMRLFNVSEFDAEDNDGDSLPDITNTKPKPPIPTKGPSKKGKFSIRDIGIAKSQLEMAKSMDELKTIFGTLGEIKAEPEIIAKKDEMKAKLAKSNAAVVTATRGGEDE